MFLISPILILMIVLAVVALVAVKLKKFLIFGGVTSFTVAGGLIGLTVENPVSLFAIQLGAFIGFTLSVGVLCLAYAIKESGKK